MSELGIWKRLMGMASAVAAVGALTILGASPAYANTSPATDDERSAVTRVLDLTDQSMPRPATESRSVAPRGSVETEVIPLPSGLQLSVGESVQVNYADGVAVHQAVAAGCTVSIEAGVPTKSGNIATAYHWYSFTSECGDSSRIVTAGLSSYAAPLWHQRAFQTRTINRGTGQSIVTQKTCANSNTTSWRAETGPGSIVLATSGEARLACSP